ncbi:MAG: S8 family serine peptidase, partial [Planctomycetes bacterium]|nr:S8 family serine peptidase [Planctomycetota bacterium]
YPGGLRDVIVAVVDSGVDYLHQDLVGNMWTNGGEIPGNDIDDDNNGFVDDIHGCSVVSDSRSHSGDPVDLNGHGTHVAGIIASQAFNQHGGVGVAYNVQIMAIRSAQYSGVLTVDDIAEGIIYATDNGAQVINMSFSGSHRSQIVEDALAVAFSRAVLVASAGNSGAKTEDAPNAPKAPHYPAALSWVLGVMASNQSGELCTFTNYDSFPKTRIEYEVAAPGIGIYSTIPGDQYAAWSGTSMAAPVVSGIAALLRSYFDDPAVYSSRFIMGQISGTGNGSTVDAYAALTEFPVPEVRMLENWLFDDEAISENNDGDGRIDAGETTHIAIELINRWGTAGEVTVTLEAKAGVVGPDPYVTIDTGTVDYPSIGPFNTVDNGFIYNDDGVIVGVENPFVVSVASDCPNDHLIPFVLTISYRNGWDLEDTTLYTQTNTFYYPVQRGRDVPSVISADLELTSDDYWLITGPVLIEPWATLTIKPGTQVQWGGISDDPYNPGPQTGSILVRGKLIAEGTIDEPVSLFPSYLVSGQTTNIIVEGIGYSHLSYTKIRNPNINGVSWLDHCYLDWDAYPSQISATLASNTIFHKLQRDPLYRWGVEPIQVTKFETCLFNAGWQWPRDNAKLFNSTFLQDNEENHPISITVPMDLHRLLTLESWQDQEWANPAFDLDFFYHRQVYNGSTYIILPMEWPSIQLAELIANYYGGNIVSIPDTVEETYLNSYVSSAPPIPLSEGYVWQIYFYMGLAYNEVTDNFAWTDQTPLAYTNWAPEFPAQLLPTKEIAVRFALREYGNVSFGNGWINEYINDSTRINGGQPDSWNAFILRLPGVLTMNDLNTPVDNGDLLAYVVEHQDPGSLDHVLYNAFLSTYWDPMLDHWMRIIGQPNKYEGYCYLQENFWGTDSTTLIDHAIWDYNDDFTSARVQYGTPPEHGYPSTYPFVERIIINDTDTETVPIFGAEPVNFKVIFNRDMNTDPNFTPFVTFGPTIPYTDFAIDPNGDGWIDARTWEGSFTITPMSGDGYHLMRVSGAVAADDPWLVSGYDVGRFRFEVKTMGVAAMTLQASGGEGQINLLWQQDDFDLLAGYNVYRSDSIDGTYERLNATIIPVGQEYFTDTDVLPAVTMYYKFTVVQTDLQESDFSNVAAAAAVDTISPVIIHIPATTAPPGLGWRLTADVADNVQVASVVLNYRDPNLAGDYTSLPMVNIAGNQWSATIPGSAVQPPGVEYYLLASDGISSVYDGTPALPHLVVVTNQPTLASVSPNHGPTTGGTPVTLSGTMFQQGASVLFDNALADNIVVISANQITCTTPPHFPAMVDVKVINPDQTESYLLNGYNFEDEGIVLSLPDTSGDYGTMVDIDLTAANVVGLRAVSATIIFDSSVLSPQSVATGTLTFGWSLSNNLGTPGVITLSLANATEVTGSGSLARITFEIVGPPPASTPLTIDTALLNDGAISFDVSHGSYTVNGLFDVKGTVNYFSSGVVSAVGLSMVGVGSYADVTDPNGEYSIKDVPTGSYTLTPAKSGDVAEITAMDASLVLQVDAGLLSLSGYETMAADVNRNGNVSSMDASYILEASVGLRDVPFPGAGKVWDFDPPQRTYPLLNSDQINQDFTAVLIGDVTGNWQMPQGSPSPQGIETMDLGPNSANLILPEVTGLVGKTISLPMEIELDSASLYAANIILQYDSSKLAINDVIIGDAPQSQGMALVVNTNIPGEIRVGLAGATPMTEDGTFLEITCDVIEAAELPVSVTFQQAQLNESAIVTTVQNGSVVALEYAPGDIDENRIVNLIDYATFIQAWQSQIGDSNWNALCDVSEPKDNIINILDLAVFAQWWIK